MNNIIHINNMNNALKNSKNYLQELGQKYGTDKAGHRYNEIGYLDYYDRHFSSIRNEVKTFVEIGILGGKSLKMWEEYFPNATIYGIDITPSCIEYESGRIKIFIGDQSDYQFLEKIKMEIGNIDILLDDGSHITNHQIKTFDILYPLINDGGFYAIEDLANSYEEILNQHNIRSIWPGMTYNKIDDTLKNYRSDFNNWIFDRVKCLDMMGYHKDQSPVKSNMIGIHFYPMVLILENR